MSKIKFVRVESVMMIDMTEQSIEQFSFGEVERSYDRLSAIGTVAQLVDGSLVVDGVVGDISVGGLKITSLPDTFSASKHSYRAVVSKKDKHFKLLVKPCWQKSEPSGRQVEIGFKILDAPWQWVHFNLTENELSINSDDAVFTA